MCVCVFFQARSICAQRAVNDKHRFLVGTCSLHDINELSVLEYSEDSNHFEAVAVYSHPDQIWAVETSPQDPSLVVTSRQSQSCSKMLTLWKMDRQTEEDLMDSGAMYPGEHLELQELSSFNSSQKVSFVDTVKWHRTSNELLTFDGRILSTWKVAEDKVSVSREPHCGEKDGSTVSFELPFALTDRCLIATAVARGMPSAACCPRKPLNMTLISRSGEAEDSNERIITANGSASWDPHNPHRCAVACGRSLSLVDTKDMEVTGKIADAHAGNIRDLDYNPNRPMTVVTGGDDGLIKIWDLRNLGAPMLHLKGHSHWVSSVRYNPYHDQLLLR